MSVIFYYERLSISFDKKRCPAVYTTASLTAFTGRALMTFQRETGYVEGGNLAIPLDGKSKRTVAGDDGRTGSLAGKRYFRAPQHSCGAGDKGGAVLRVISDDA